MSSPLRDNLTPSPSPTRRGETGSPSLAGAVLILPKGKGRGIRFQRSLKAELLPLALLAPVLLAAACAVPSMTFRTVKIGLVAPLSGEAAGEGGRWVIAARQAVDVWNADPTHGDVRKELVVLDEAEGEAAVQSLVLDPRVVGVVGYARPTAARASLGRLAAAGMPVLVAGSESEAQPSDGAGAQYLTASHPALAQELAAYAAGPLQLRVVSVVVGPDATDRAIAAVFRESGAAAGIAFREVPMPASPADVRTFSDRVSTNGVQAVFLATSSGDARTLLPLLDARPRPLPVLLAPRTATGEASRELERLDVYWAGGAPDPAMIPEAKDFVDRYRSQTGTAPAPGAALVYDAMGLILRAIDGPARTRGSPSRASVQDSLRTAGEAPGILGRHRFGEDGRRQGARAFVFLVNRSQPFPGRQVGAAPE
ncbi:MAG: ABC transporter substrate-binding protein [Dehalococcoidia bacterium]|nr:ABC transporter substrate-binding protein [Dehalococcoidia bacterium]